jgi:hypothetical protein
MRDGDALINNRIPSPECAAKDALALFHPAVRKWFTVSFAAPTAPQIQGWPAIAKGDSTLSLAPTGCNACARRAGKSMQQWMRTKKQAPLFAGEVVLIRIHSSCQIHPLIAQT